MVVCGGLVVVEPGFPLPVLTPVAPGTSEDVSERLLRALTEAMREQLREAGQYADLTARSLVDGSGPGRLLSWVARRHDARVTVHDGFHEEAWPEEVRSMEDVQQLRALVRGLALAPVRLTTRGRHVQVWPVGAEAPYRLLVATRARPWSAQTHVTMGQVAMVVAGLLREESITTREVRLKTAVEAARTSAFQFLVVGDVYTAQRTIGPLAPGLLGAEAIQIAIAETAPGEARTTLAAEVETALGEARAMPVLCPVEDGQVIVLWDASQGLVQSVLEPVAQGAQGRAVGVSGRGSLERTPMLYETAAASVPAARRMPTSVAVHDGRPALEKLLDPSARAWARQLLAPVEVELPDALERKQFFTVCRTAIMIGATGTANLLSRHRQTIASRLDDLTRLVGLDRTWLADRMTLDLALRLADLDAPAAGTVPAAGMTDALDQEAARVWGQTVLADLPPRLLNALVAWARSGLNIQHAARELDISRNTLSEWLREASGYVKLPLSKDRPGKQHEAVWALHVTGRVPLSSTDWWT